jgi:hypothetical protein
MKEKTRREKRKKKKATPVLVIPRILRGITSHRKGLLMRCMCDVVSARGLPSSAKRVYEGKCCVLLYSFF